jgi:hypothetical protein
MAMELKYGVTVWGNYFLEAIFQLKTTLPIEPLELGRKKMSLYTGLLLKVHLKKKSMP